MKYLIYLTVGLLFLLPTGCERNAQKAETTPADSIGGNHSKSARANSDTLLTDSVSYSLHGAEGSCDVYIDYPTGGPPQVVKALREFIRTTLLDDLTASVADDPQSLAREYCERRQEAHAKTLEQMETAKVGADEAPEEGMEIRLLCLTDRFVTYEVYRYSYTTHAAHGEYAEYGVTFRLSDGRRMSYILNKVDENLFLHIREGLKRYFHVKSDAQLEAMCTTDLSLLPMPTFPPYMIREGVVFHYSIYDLCAFDDGDPKVLVPYPVAIPYMTEEARQLVPQN